jgi:hypothetical protein
MAGKKRDKDHLKDHARVELVTVIAPPPSDDEDPLRWWTQHPTEAIEVDLRVFAEGQAEHRYVNSGLAATWAGPFTGRPKFIHELAPWVKEKTLLNGPGTAVHVYKALRRWWRLFDALEATPLPGDQRLARVESVADLTQFHEAGAQQDGVPVIAFNLFLGLANKARMALGLSRLHWVPPDSAAPDRQLISDDMARVLLHALKNNWRAVLKDWELRDQIRAEGDRRDQGAAAVDLGPEGERLLANWRQFQRAAPATKEVLASSAELMAGITRYEFRKAGLTLTDMRAMEFPTVWEADAAYHMALLDSAWNPSTMLNVDAADPYCVAASLKDSKSYMALRATESDEASVPDGGEGSLSMGAPKPRARGKVQICHGLAKNKCCAPYIVRAFIQRSEPLRVVLRAQLRDAIAEHARLKATGANDKELGKAFMRVQDLKQGVRCVWVYLGRDGSIGWFKKGDTGVRYGSSADSRWPISYLAKVTERLAEKGKTIGHVTPSDLRDLAARKYFRKTGSILALMLRLGHSSVRTTAGYVDNQVTRRENDEVARRFLDDLFSELGQGRVDLTILAQLARHGPLSAEMEARLIEYRSLMRSRLGVGCSDPRNPPQSVDPDHAPGGFCGSHRCMLGCPHATFLPESLDGIAMRAEELMTISNLIPREAWLRELFHDEQETAEALLERYYAPAEVAKARDRWRARIESGHHPIPGLPMPV